MAVIAGTLTPGGAEKQLAYHVRCLAGAGVEVLLLSLDGEGYYGRQLEPMVHELVCIDQSWGRWGRLARIVSVVKRFSPDIVQATHTYVNLYAYAAARACGAVSIGALRGVLHTSTESNGWFNRWHLAAPDAVIANSHRAAQELQQEMRRGGRDVYVLENALDLKTVDREMRPRDDLRRMAGASEDDVLVLGVGTLRDGKGFDRFLRVLERARAHDPHLKGVLIGDGPAKEKLEGMKNGAPLLAEGLTFAGRHPEAVRLMRGADVFLLTSEHEGFPNTLLEAMAAGLPSVVTPAGDAGRVIETSASGLVHSADDEAGMAESLVALGRSRSHRRQLGERARRYTEEQLDFTLLSSRLWHIYSAIAASSDRRQLAQRLDFRPGCFDVS